MKVVQFGAGGDKDEWELEEKNSLDELIDDVLKWVITQTHYPLSTCFIIKMIITTLTDDKYYKQIV